MTKKPEYFELQELVCPHVFFRFGEMAWQFLDPRQLILMDWIRKRLGPVYVNNWYEDHLNSDYIKYIKERMTAKLPIIENDVPKPPQGLFDERGLRCNICDLVLAKSKKGIAYLSPHILGMADDFYVQGRLAEETRQYLIKNKNNIPFPIRLENGVSWVHMDCEDTGQKVYLFNP